MTPERQQRVEFGDFQTPDELALQVCRRLVADGLRPASIIEPTCGVGAFVIAALEVFQHAVSVLGFEVNEGYLSTLRDRLQTRGIADRAHLQQADFFQADWPQKLKMAAGPVLVLGNFPWVTNATQGSIGGGNLPTKSNFLGFGGFDAISGKANFDISEWMLLDVLRWLEPTGGDVAMLVKTAVARKVIAHAARQKAPLKQAYMAGIDAKKSFGASVDACLLVLRLDPECTPNYDYTIFASLNGSEGQRVGHRNGSTVGDLDAYERAAYLVGESPQKWRSGVKHDAAAVMEFTRRPTGYENGLGEIVELEDTYLFPLLKGSDVGSSKNWREKFVLVTQRSVGEETASIQCAAPLTWLYLERHSTQLDGRGSTIYRKNPKFSIFGVGDYAFRPWKIAICGLYKTLNFRLIGPIEGKPVMFDDTVYYISFDSEGEAKSTLATLSTEDAQSLLRSLVFWDEKRPIKTSILNTLDWSKFARRSSLGAVAS